MAKRTVRLLGSLTIDFTKVRSVLSDDDRPIWAGKIVLTSDERADGDTKVVTANLVDCAIVDMEGECEEGDPIYSVMERWTSYIVDAIEAELGKPSRFDAMAA